MLNKNKLVRISSSHSNRGMHNWLAYKCGDEYLMKDTHLYKGVLYDLGAGESPYKNFFLQFAESYISVDWSNSYHGVNVDLVADLNGLLPIESSLADTVVSFSVLEHLCEPQVMLCEAFRILRPGGNLILQVPWQWRIHEEPYDFFRYTPYGLRYLLEKAGFISVEIAPMSGFFTMLILKLNYFSLRLIRGPKILRVFSKYLLAPFWYFGQIVAPWLDSFDRNWSSETAGYFVTAQKSK